MTPAEFDGRIVALQTQRDQAMNQVVILSGELARLAEQLTIAQTALEAQKPKSKKAAPAV